MKASKDKIIENLKKEIFSINQEKQFLSDELKTKENVISFLFDILSHEGINSHALKTALERQYQIRL